MFKFSENIIRLRKDKGVTQEQVADFLGVTKASVSKWETKQSMPGISLLPIIATSFDVSIDELLGFQPELSVEEIEKICVELTKEFTDPMPRWKIMISKCILMLALWTGMYFLSYIITYVYNDFYWDNDIAKHLFFSAFCLYLLGVWLISLIMLMSALSDNSATVSIGICGGFLISYILGIVPALQDYLPTKLMEGSKIPFGLLEPTEFTAAMVIVSIWSTINIALPFVAAYNQK